MRADLIWSTKYLNHAREKILDVHAVSEHYPGRPVILTKGVFDVLHSGHLALLSMLGELRTRTDTNAVTVVAVAVDALVTRKKGLERPVTGFRERCLQVALHPFVDVVIPDRGPNLSGIVETVEPVIFVKGQDTALGSPDEPGGDEVILSRVQNPELDALQSLSAQAIVFCDEGHTSTSGIIRTIVERYCT